MSDMELATEQDILQRYRESHHRVAQLVAMGCTLSFIRQHTGRSTRSIQLLMADPTFQELVRIKAKRQEVALDEAQDDMFEMMVANARRTDAMIQDQLDEAEETGTKIGLLTLNKIWSDRADRIGYSKHQVITHEHNFGARLDRAVERSGKSAEMKTIEAKAEVVPPTTALPMSQGVAVPSHAVGVERPPQPKRADVRSLAATLSNGIKRRKVA